MVPAGLGGERGGQAQASSGRAGGERGHGGRGGGRRAGASTLSAIWARGRPGRRRAELRVEEDGPGPAARRPVTACVTRHGPGRGAQAGLWRVHVGRTVSPGARCPPLGPSGGGRWLQSKSSEQSPGRWGAAPRRPRAPRGPPAGRRRWRGLPRACRGVRAGADVASFSVGSVGVSNYIYFHKLELCFI